MRRTSALLLVLAALPATLRGQSPDSGRYPGDAVMVEDGRRIPLVMEVVRTGDSTAVRLRQGEEELLPLGLVQLAPWGFIIQFFGFECPFVVTNERWEAVCSDGAGAPQFTLVFPRRAEATRPRG